MRARQAWNYSEFCQIATRDEQDFNDLGVVVSQGYAEGSTYTFMDNGSDVLGVAHLDTVQHDAHSTLIRVNKQPILLCPRLDDRLGVYIITKMLPRLGIVCDWLLTTGEEIGQSSAELFKTDKVYNWAFSFDRAGTDCVMYQFEHKALKKLVRKAGFRVGQGSFSDLSFLEIGCSGINFGCGYQDCHSLHAYAPLNDTFAMVDLFAAFYKKYANQPLPYAPKWRKRSYRDYCGYGSARHGFGSLRGYSSYTRGWPDDIGTVEAEYEHNLNSRFDDNGIPDYQGLSASDRAYLDWVIDAEAEDI